MKTKTQNQNSNFPRYPIYFGIALILCVVAYFYGKNSGSAELEAGGIVGGLIVAILFVFCYFYLKFRQPPPPPKPTLQQRKPSRR
jgi:Na+/melibiose symporter-like transporter